MKIIFLDIDGVLNNYASLAEGIQLCNDKCILIRNIVNATGTKIVISSSWRIGSKLEELAKALWYNGVPYGSIIDITPFNGKFGSKRGDEIEEWCEQNGMSKYCIIDDDSDMLSHQEKYFVKTDMRTGLTSEDSKKVIDILNGFD